MSLKDEDLEQIAYLAKINIDKSKFPFLKKELESILSLVEKMNSADTESVEAMSHPLDISQPLRKDKVTEEDNWENLQKNAPSIKAGLFLVPKVIDGED
tara:strand:+ start:92 stop:388 length:297 start_codon:yes stop_codon:yes gene_type:complete